MASNNYQASVATLRAIAYRISSTPTEQLPKIAAHISRQLWQCKHLLASSPDQLKQHGDASVVVHKYKTHLSTLLQDRTVEGRWSAVVLVKATIEAGGVETLSKSNAWVRNLLGILKKPDPPTTRILAVITLTRIFMLTWDHTNLVREITTPALPAFIATCLNNADVNRCSAPELKTILESFVTLLPRHHTTFRTNESQLRSLASTMLSATSASNEKGVYFTEDQREIASRLLGLLHYCSPKQSSAEKWDGTLKSTVAAAHSTCDRIFRAVIEDWTSSTGVQNSVSQQVLFKGEPEMEDSDLAGLSGWKGIFAGSERLIALFKILKSQFEIVTAAPVTFRIGMVMDLLIRVLSLVTPRPGTQDSIKGNPQVSRDERESLYSVLPAIHIAAFGVIGAILQRYSDITLSIMQTLMSQIVWVFRAEYSEPLFRIAAYKVVREIFDLRGPIMAKEDVLEAEIVIKHCCDDLLSSELTTTGSSLKSSTPQTSIIVPSATFVGLESAAKKLLTITCRQVDPANVSKKTRAQMERTAILTENQEALVACVINPKSNSFGRSRTDPSLLPLLARKFPHAPEVETILRPRMPTLRRQALNPDLDDQDDEDEEEPRETNLDEAVGEASDILMADKEEQSALSDPFDTTNRPAPNQDAAQRFSIQQSHAFNMPSTSSEKRQSPLTEESASSERPEKRIRTSPARELRGDHGKQAPSQPPKPTAQAPETIGHDDDSDFEMPALTMDQDTDEE